VTKTATNSWKVSLSRTLPRRVVLDARASQNYSFSQVSYYWGWATPDPRTNTDEAQVDIETPYASTAALTISASSKYRLYLTVHDGCDVAYFNFTLDAQCSEPASTLDPNVTVSSDGRNLNTFVLSMKQDDKQIQCSSNTWTLTNFTPASSSSVPTLSFSILVIFFLSIFAIFFP